jgi:double-stranded uracil-DNA glycosylase
LATPWKPTKEQLAAAANKTVPDVIGRRLKVIFSGINPGLYTAAVGHHFARPGNRFWPALFASGFTDRIISPFDERLLLKSGYGITNLVQRATATADQLSPDELREGCNQLTAKVLRYQPRFLAILGLGAYRTAWERPKAVIGRQSETIGDTKIWVLPNPSGLNAHYQPKQLAQLFSELKAAVDAAE